MRAEYENVLDDHLGKIHFTYVNTWDELLPAHWHEHLEIIYVLGGEITASINDVSYELKKGDIGFRFSVRNCATIPLIFQAINLKDMISKTY